MIHCFLWRSSCRVELPQQTQVLVEQGTVSGALACVLERSRAICTLKYEVIFMLHLHGGLTHCDVRTHFPPPSLSLLV